MIRNGCSTSISAAGLLILAILLPTAAEADKPLAEADRLRLAGRYEEAAQRYQTAAANQPSAAIGLARCRAAVGKLDEAERQLREAVQKHPASAAIAAELAWLQLQRGHQLRAQQQAQRALRLDPKQLLARWTMAELHRVQGKLEEAQQGYEWFIDYYNQRERIDDPEALHWIGLAAAQYARWTRNSRQFHFLVNELYPDALQRNPSYWPAHLEAARLYLEKYNQAQATAELDAALTLNPRAAEVHAERARLALQNFQLAAAERSIQQALRINPQLLTAQQLKADLLFADLRPAEAIPVLQAALEGNPLCEETLGRLAAAYVAIDGAQEAVEDSRLSRLLDKVHQQNPRCGRFFAVLGASLDRMRKFPQAARYLQQARQRMPQLVEVHGQLGLLYMRLGEEGKAAQLLEESFDIDPYNVRVKNMLEVLDVLKGYAVLETEHFVLRFDRGHDELLARYAARYLEDEVYPTVVQSMGFEPPGKTLLEIFNRARNTDGHGWFSARMVGLPYIGTVGACAGRVVALASPNGLPEKYDWARVLKHEFVHVVNLQQTDFNVPHWFTEALAVLHEDLPRPPLWDEVLARRSSSKNLYNLDTINQGFIRPANSEDWALAYCQAELYAQYLVDEFGGDALAHMLEAFADRNTTSQALQRCFGIDQEKFERGYQSYVQQIVKGMQRPTRPTQQGLGDLLRAVESDADNADLLAQLAQAYLRRDRKAQARQYAIKAQQKMENHQLAAYVLARLQLSIGDVSQAQRILQQALDTQTPQEDALELLAALKTRSGEYGEATRLYRLGARHHPHPDKWLKALARVYLTSGDEDNLAKALPPLADLDPDNPLVRKKLAQLHLKKQDFAVAQRWANAALHIDVMDAESHGLLGQALGGLGAFDRSIEELEVAIQLAPDRLPWRFMLADSCLQAGDKTKAQKVLEELLAIDPDYPGADVLLESLRP